MKRLLRAVGRELLLATPGLREKFLERQFLERRQTFRGVYRSFAEAQAHAPKSRALGYEHEDDTVNAEVEADRFNPADYPVVYWLARILPEARRVFDLGGNTGVAFYAYRPYLDYTPDLRWTVCEIPSTVMAGRALAEKRGETQLTFTEDRAEAEGADVYFSAGALQYIEEPFGEILKRLERRPRHVLLHRVPMQADAPFVTLQNNGTWMAPYRVVNEGELVGGVTELGYERVAQWPTYRQLQVLSHPLGREAVYQGMYLRLRG